jgi:acyl carrier protein
MSVETEIREVLASVGHLAVAAGSLAPDSDLFAAGLTSQAAVELVFGLEDRLGIEIPDHLIRRESLGSIAQLIATVQAAGGSA